MDLRIDGMVRGTRLLVGDMASNRRDMINKLIEICKKNGFSEVVLPYLEKPSLYFDKMGGEVESQMYVFQDKKGRDLCLRPEGTATLQALARGRWRQMKDVKVFYVVRCWRYERPQMGRYREFTQFGVEVLNPTQDYNDFLVSLAEEMVCFFVNDYVVEKSVKRGLDYYTDDGFEVLVPGLGAQKQVVGGGKYSEGVGFAVGVDRLLLASV